jgi:hypothetical protein
MIDIARKMRCIEFPRLFFLEFRISELEFQFLNFSTAEFKKKIRPESLESKTESEFRFRWGSQKSEPKIGIPNLDDQGGGHGGWDDDCRDHPDHHHRGISRGGNDDSGGNDGSRRRQPSRHCLRACSRSHSVVKIDDFFAGGWG